MRPLLVELTLVHLAYRVRRACRHSASSEDEDALQTTTGATGATGAMGNMKDGSWTEVQLMEIHRYMKDIH